VDVFANGRRVGAWPPPAPDTPIVVPEAVLFRGDNRLTLRGPAGEVRLLGLTYAGL
jgi:hypothetical protein